MKKILLLNILIIIKIQILIWREKPFSENDFSPFFNSLYSFDSTELLERIEKG
jgi:hypothetical protein